MIGVLYRLSGARLPSAAGLVWCAAAFGLSACSVGPDFKPPAALVPTAFMTRPSSEPTTGRAIPKVDLTQWWRSFRDPELDSLVERAVAANPDVAIALTRLQQARAQELVVVGSTLPEGETSAGAAYGTGSDNTRGRVSQTLHSAGNTSGFTQINEAGGFDADWELDIFGKLRREVEAANFDALAAEKAREAVLVSVIADVARAYIDLRGLQAQLAVTQKNVETAQRSLGVVQTRFKQGLTNELDVTLAQRQLSTVQAGLGPLSGRLQASQFVIAVLLGQYPESLAVELRTPRPLPMFPAAVPIGLPIDLLKRRPDIQQAELEVGAATAHLGSVMADLFPRVGVTGALGGQGGVRAASGTPITFIGGIGPSLYWPVLDFGTLDARIEVADFQTRGALQGFRSGVLHAVEDVDQSIVGYNAEQNRLANLKRARVAALQAVKLSSERYDRGLTDFLNVLDAEREEFDIEAQYVQSQEAGGDDLVSLYKALGGGWERYDAVPAVRRPDPALEAAVKLIGRPDGPRAINSVQDSTLNPGGR